MAIEIIPKPEAGKLKPLANFLFFSSIFLLVLSLVSYFYFSQNAKNLKNLLQELEEEISQVQSQKIEKLEGEISLWRQKIETYNFLFTQYQVPSNIFSYIEKITHPQVWFSKFDLNINSGTLNLAARARSYQVVGEQFLFLQTQDFIKKRELSGLSKAKEGEVEFNFSMTVDKKIFEPKLEIGE